MGQETKKEKKWAGGKERPSDAQGQTWKYTL